MLVSAYGLLLISLYLPWVLTLCTLLLDLPCTATGMTPTIITMFGYLKIPNSDHVDFLPLQDRKWETLLLDNFFGTCSNVIFPPGQSSKFILPAISVLNDWCNLCPIETTMLAHKFVGFIEPKKTLPCLSLLFSIKTIYTLSQQQTTWLSLLGWSSQHRPFFPTISVILITWLNIIREHFQQLELMSFFSPLHSWNENNHENVSNFDQYQEKLPHQFLAKNKYYQQLADGFLTSCVSPSFNISNLKNNCDDYNLDSTDYDNKELMVAWWI